MQVPGQIPDRRQPRASSAGTAAASDRAAISRQGASISDGPASARSSISALSVSEAGAGAAARAGRSEGGRIE